MSFTKVTLETAINTLASKGKIYSNESQFQFDLAWELRKQGLNIELEVLSANCTPDRFANLPKEERKKYYSDIVVKDGDEYIAIELKYKTPDVGRLIRYECNGKNHYLAAQGAENMNSYLFWKDVERLENMVIHEIPLNFDGSKKIKKGYAVLLTNDSFYWDENNRGVSLANAFFLTKGREVNGCIKGTLAGDTYSIILQGTYCIDTPSCRSCSYNSSCSSLCEWKEYLGWETKPSISEVEIYEVASSVKYTVGSAVVLPGYLADKFCYLIVEVSNGQSLCGLAPKVNNIAKT